MLWFILRENGISARGGDARARPRKSERRRLTATPTAPDRPFHRDGFATLTEALDFAAQGPTGINLYGLRGELIEALPYGELRARARAMATRFLAAGLEDPATAWAWWPRPTSTSWRAFFACQYARADARALPCPAPLGGRDGLCGADRPHAGLGQRRGRVRPESLLPWLQDAANDRRDQDSPCRSRRAAAGRDRRPAGARRRTIPATSSSPRAAPAIPPACSAPTAP